MSFIQQYFHFITILLGCFAAGKAAHIIFFSISKTRKLPVFATLFFEFLTGLTVWVVGYSIIETKFITVNSIFLVVAFLLIREQRKLSPLQSSEELEEARNKKIGFVEFIMIGLVSLIIFSWAYFFILPDAGFQDYVIYARQSFFLPITGQENEFYLYNLLDDKYHGTSPYYYFMLWSNALVTQLFGGNSATNFTLFFPSVCLFIFYLGILALWERFGKVKKLAIVFSLILLFAGGLVLEIYTKYPQLTNILVYSWSMPISNIKFFPLYLFYLSFIVLLLYDAPVNAAILLTGVALVSITAVPAVIGGLVLFVLFAWRMHLYEKPILKRIIFNFGVILLLVVLFYLAFGGKSFQRSDMVASQPAIEKIIRNIFDPVNIRTRINIVAHALVFIWIPYILFAALLVSFWKKWSKSPWKKSLQTIMLAGGCIFLSSLFGWMCLFDELASNRIFEASAPMMNCLLLFSFIAFISTSMRSNSGSSKHILVATVGILLIGFCAYNQVSLRLYKLNAKYDSNSGHSINYIQDLTKVFDSSEIGNLGAGIKGEEDFANEQYGFVTYNTIRGDYLFLLNNNWITLSISDYSEATIRPDSGLANKLYNRRREKYLSLGIFYQFVQKQKKANQFQSIEQSQVDFINKYKITYLVVSPIAKLSGLLQQKIKREIVDSESGDRFIILND